MTCDKCGAADGWHYPICKSGALATVWIESKQLPGGKWVYRRTDQ